MNTVKEFTLPTKKTYINAENKRAKSWHRAQRISKTCIKTTHFHKKSTSDLVIFKYQGFIPIQQQGGILWQDSQRLKNVY